MDAKKMIVLVVIVVFLGFWMINDPAGLAETAKSGGGKGWEMTTDLFSGIIDFVGKF